MPSTSAKQHRFMEMVAHNSKRAKQLGISQKVGRDFVNADKGKKFAKGGHVDNDEAEDKKIAAEAVHRHERNMHKGWPLTKLKEGGMPKEHARHGKVHEPDGGDDLGLGGGKHGKPHEPDGGKDLRGGGHIKKHKKMASGGRAMKSLTLKKGGHVLHSDHVMKHAGGFPHHHDRLKKMAHGHEVHDHHRKSHVAKHDRSKEHTPKAKRFAKGGGLHISPKSLGTVKGLSGRMSPDTMERQAVRGAGETMPANMPGSRLFKRGGKVPMKYSHGGHTASRRGDGVASRGHTKGRMV